MSGSLVRMVSSTSTPRFTSSPQPQREFAARRYERAGNPRPDAHRRAGARPRRRCPPRRSPQARVCPAPPGAPCSRCDAAGRPNMDRILPERSITVTSSPRARMASAASMPRMPPPSTAAVREPPMSRSISSASAFCAQSAHGQPALFLWNRENAFAPVASSSLS